ncbi:MAG: asparagine synthase (glutamine-hydrolyzing) [Thermodesulfobacteriota bacterium]
MNMFFGSTLGKDTRNISGKPISYDESGLGTLLDGEIYNTAELRRDLEAAGFGFDTTTTPSQLIAKAYKTWGESCIKKLNGAFSICFHDRSKDTLYIARDHVGRKPIYYATRNGKIVFSSKISPILKTPGISRDIDLSALNYYLTYRYIPEDLCIFKDIRKIPAGCALRFTLSSGETEMTRYWEPPTVESSGMNESALLDELEEILLDSIRLRMNGDQNTGALLSGGLDSSLIVAVMSKLSSKRVKTFTISFKDDKFSEIPFSRIVSRHFGTDSEEFVVEPDFDSLVKAVSLFDEPLADPSIFPSYFAGKLASSHCDSIISGEGADSLFIGFRSHRLSIKYRDFKKYILPPLSWLSGALAAFIPQEVKWRIFLNNLTPEEFFLSRMMVYSAPLREKLLQGWVLEELGDRFHEPERLGASIMGSYDGTLTGKMGYLNFKSDPDDILYKLDRISSHFSYEVRTPFLDSRMVEFAFGKVPGDLKLKQGTTKYLLKKLAKKFLPPKLPLERKRGFNPPFSRWLKHDWSDYARDILLSGDEGFFNRDYIEKLLKRNKSAVSDEGRRIFCLLVFKIWEQNVLSGDT